MTTRRILLGTALGTGLLLAAGTGQAADEVSLRLNWYLGGLHTPFYLGKERGYFEEEGIDLTINEGRGSGNTAQLIGAKSDTFGMSDAGSMMLAAAKGMPIKSVMAVLNSSSFAFVSLAETPITECGEIKGKTLAGTAGGALTQLLPAVLAANGLTEDDVTVVMVDPPAKPVAVMEGQADALMGGIDDQPFLMAEKGFETVNLRFADCGVDSIGMVIHTHEDTIAESPDLIARFVRASIKSWDAARENPQAAIDAALKVKPDLNAASQLGQLEVDLSLTHSANTMGEPFGSMSDADWQRTFEIMRDYRGMETDRDAASFYTLEFLPQ